MAEDAEGPNDNGARNGKLKIPLPFEKALKAATEVPADRLPPPKTKLPKTPRKPAKG